MQATPHRVVGVGTTTGAQTVVLCSYAPPSGCAVRVKAEVVGRETTTGDAAGFSKAALMKTPGGVLAGVGSVLDAVTPSLDTALATATATIAVNGSAIELRATGLLGQNVEWTGELIVWMG